MRHMDLVEPIPRIEEYSSGGEDDDGGQGRGRGRG